MIRVCILAGVCLLALTSCHSVPTGQYYLVHPESSEYLRTVGGYFSMDTSKPGIDTRYALILHKRKPLPLGSVLEVNFDNPENMGEPITITQIVDPNMAEIKVSSPEINGVKAHKKYMIDILIFKDHSKRQIIGRHQQMIKSFYDEDRFKEMMNRKQLDRR